MARPVILSESMAARALADPKFTALLPEFSGVKQRSIVIERTAVGCRHCQKATMYANVLREFIYVVMALGEEPKSKLKKYLGIESLMLNTYDPKTNQVGVKII